MTDESLIQNADAIIEKFGGIRPMATKLGVPVTTVQGWKKRNAIPGHRRDLIRKYAQEHQLDLGDLMTLYVSANAGVPPKEAINRARTNEMIFNTTQSSRHTGLWTGLIVLGGFIIGAAILFGPRIQTIKDQSEKIAVLEKTIEQLEAEKTRVMTASIIPEGVQHDLAVLRSQAESIQGKITDLSTQAQTMGEDLQNKIGGLAQNIGAESLSGVLLKIQAWQADPQTAPLVSQATARLYALVSQATTPDQLQEKLQMAQQSTDSLGETLKNVPVENLKAAASLIAFNQFRSALERDNTSFSSDLDLLKKLLAANDPDLSLAIDRLAPQASEGVLTNEGLSTEFRNIAGDIVVASLSGQNVDVKEKLNARFRDIIQVEKDGKPVNGTQTQQRVQAAQNMIDQGDIPAAIVSLQGIEGPAKQVAQAWINKAQASLLAGQIRDTVQNTIGSLVPRPGGVPYSAASGPIVP